MDQSNMLNTTQLSVSPDLYTQLLSEQIKGQELQNRLWSLEIASTIDYKVAARTGTAGFLSTYLPAAVALGLGAGLAQFSVNAANNVNGKR